MEFRTKIKLDQFPIDINYEKKVIMMGSCFSGHIGEKLARCKFDVLSNPFGIVYNAATLYNQVSRSLTKKYVLVEELALNPASGLFSHFDFHSDFSHHDKTAFLQRTQKEIDKTQAWLAESELLIITLGTSYVYRKVSDTAIVGNCHKFPSSLFKKELLSVEEQGHYIKKLIKAVKVVNPDIEFLFTVSPVRHIKEGLAKNNLSKSILRVVCEEIQKEDNVYYFPSYEMVLDDLRDYRFYEADMIHPNSQAINYIWNSFKLSFMSETTQKVMQEVESQIMNMEHRYLNPLAQASINHRNQTEENLSRLLESYPFLRDRFSL